MEFYELSAALIHGETDDFSYNVVKGCVHVRDFHAMVLNLLGFDRELATTPLRAARGDCPQSYRLNNVLENYE